MSTAHTLQPLIGNQDFSPSIFEIDKEKGLVNLTKIAKHFDKRVNDWAVLSSTQRFLNAFFSKNPEPENLVVVNGGLSGNGTWASRKIAIKFAEWISVDFEIFTNDILDELFQKGTVSIRPQTMLERMEAMAHETLEAVREIKLRDAAIFELESRNAIAEETIEHKDNVIVDMTSTVESKTFRDKVNEICRFRAKGMYGARFNKLYREYKYRYHTDIKIRARNAGYTDVLEYAEANDYIEKLYTLALLLFEVTEKEETEDNKNIVQFTLKKGKDIIPL